MSVRRRLITALALSAAVYFVPVLTPHWIDVFGHVIVRELNSERQLAWKLADVGLLMLLQATAFAVAWLLVPRSRFAAVGVTLLLCMPAAIIVNGAYLSTIPSLFLIESDDTPDRSSWTDECSLPGVALASINGGATRGLNRRGEAWLRTDDGAGYALLQMPECRVEKVVIPEWSTAGALHQALPDGSLVYATPGRGVSARQYWLLRRHALHATPLAPLDARTDSVPLVANDGAWVAWLQRSPEREVALDIEPLAGGQPVLFTHALLQRATVVPIELDMPGRRVLINRDLSTFASLTLDGTVEWGPLAPGTIAAQYQTFQYLDGQWLAWDAYVEDARYRVAWSTRAGQGEYQAPRGRAVTSAAMDTAGRFVAVSTATSLNIGAIQDTIVVLRTSDRREMLRRTLPAYNRSEVAFLDGRYFVYSEIVQGHSVTHVMRASE